MPGVPSGKGCDACRKQKKKCDQAKPACSRCTRLSIPCVGGGQQRYKFKVQVLESGPNEPIKTVTKKVRSPPNAFKISIMPNGRTTNLAGTFVSRLAVTDLRYDINTYGTFLRYLPQRIGQNEALDASVDAFTSALESLHTGSHSHGLIAFTKYGEALKAVRDCLNDPKKAQTAETMCAIYLVMVAQGWIGPPSHHNAPSHAEGLAYLLKAMAAKDWRGAFEMEMLATMCVPVVMESIVNPRIKLHPWFYEMLDRLRGPDGPPHPDFEKIKRLNPDVFSSISIRNLSRYPTFLKAPVANHLDILSAYHMLRIDCQKLRRKCETLNETDILTRPSMSVERIQHGMRVAYNICLVLALLLNTILQEFDPADTTLMKEKNTCIDEIIQDAERAFKYRPLGSSHIPLALSMAWATCKDEGLKAYVTTLMNDYKNDFSCSDWNKMGQWWKTKLDRVREQVANRDIDPALDDGWTTPESETGTLDGDCYVQ